jgi:hypothetical protein
LARFTDDNNKGIDMIVLSDDFPEVNPERVFNANGSLHFGPDGHLYFTLGDYDQAQDIGPNGLKLPQDLGTPIGKMLRVNKEDGQAVADNPFVDDETADPRIFASGFGARSTSPSIPRPARSMAPTAPASPARGYHYSGGRELRVAGPVPFNDCSAGRSEVPIGYLSQEGRKPEDFDSTVAATGMEFVSGDDYAVLGDSLVYCEGGRSS